jgi:hypothetical protein
MRQELLLREGAGGGGREREKESEGERDVGQSICVAGIAPVLRLFQGSFKALLRLY